MNKSIQLHRLTKDTIRNKFVIPTLGASGSTQQSESPHDAGTDLVVLGLGVAVAPELRRLTQQAASEPGAVPLALVCDDRDIQTTAASTAAASLGGTNTSIHQVTNITL
jgi:hypothetical protein